MSEHYGFDVAVLFNAKTRVAAIRIRSSPSEVIGTAAEVRGFTKRLVEACSRAEELTKAKKLAKKKAKKKAKK